MSIRVCRLGQVVIAVGLVVIGVVGPVSRGDEFIDRANGLYAGVPLQRRSDAVLLPVLARMDAPPPEVSSAERAWLLPATSPAFASAAAWAQSQPQRDVLDALDRITREEDPIHAMVFAQPYGAEAVATGSDGMALIRAGLYTDLGDPPLLAGARFLYLEALDRLGMLVHVEATRQAAEGRYDAALDLLMDWVFFGRQMAERAFFQEARWGWRTMATAAERIRDLAYQDFRSPRRQMPAETIAVTLQRLRPEGYVNFDRVALPRGERIAAEQVIARVFVPRRGPDPALFAPTMARLSSTRRPLRLFSEAARWEAIIPFHANQFETQDMLAAVYGDFETRWPLDPFDPLMRMVPQYERMPRVTFAVVAAVVPDMMELFNDRQITRTQLVGTRCALGLVGFHLRNRNWPPSIASIRPAWVREIEADPYNPDRARGKQPPLEYFVPVRDTPQNPRGDPVPHEINVVTRNGRYNFQVAVGPDQFVLYSVGPDGSKDWARNVSAEPQRGAIGDLLIWPPVMSLLRQRLIETGEIR